LERGNEQTEKHPQYNNDHLHDNIESINNASASKRSTTRNTQLDDIDEELRERGQQAAENAHRRDDHGQEKTKAAAARRCVLEQERRNEVPMQSRCGNLWRGSQSGEMPR
jgi:hypothetical protein